MHSQMQVVPNAAHTHITLSSCNWPHIPRRGHKI